MKNVELPERLAKAFRNEHYLAINKARMDHLESLAIDWKGKNVLDLGAGIGDFSGWLIEKGAQVMSFDGREENCEIMRARGLKPYCLNLDGLMRFEHHDIAFCYGLIYHLESPWKLLRCLAGSIPILLLETRIVPSCKVEHEPEEDPSQSITGKAFIPSKEWLDGALAVLWGGVLIPPQPNHPEYRNGQRIVMMATNEEELCRSYRS